METFLKYLLYDIIKEPYVFLQKIKLYIFS